MKNFFSNFKFNKHFYVFIIFLRAVIFWVGWAIFKPGMPFSVALMYRERGQDIEYFPFMTMLASSGLKDATDYLIHGTRVVSFPFGSAWIHSILYNSIGIAGVVLADFLVATAVFFLLAKVLLRFGTSEFIADTLSLFIVIGVTGKLAGLSGAIHPMLGAYDQVIELLVFFCFLWLSGLAILKKKVYPWGLILSGGVLLLLLARTQWEYFFWRFPRPFVTEIYFLSFVLLAMKLLVEKNVFKAQKSWFLLGVVFPLLLQSELHETFYCGLVLGVLVLVKMKDGFKLSELFRSFLTFLIPFVLLSIPFFIQRMHESPDLRGRYGLYDQSRSQLFFWFSSIMDQDLYLFSFLAVLFYFAFLYFRNHETNYETNENLGRGKQHFLVLFVAYVISFFSVTLFTLVTGKVIVPGRFYTILIYLTTLGTMIGGGVLLTQIMRLKCAQSFRLSQRWVYFAVTCIAIINLGMGAHKSLVYQDHTRTDFEEYAHLPHYQQNFSELIKRLSGEDIPQNFSIATLDMQVYHWWGAVKRGRAFLPSQYASPLSNEELEDRLMAFGHELGFQSDEFVQLVTGRMVNLFFFTCWKYHFEKGHLYSTWDDYLPEDQYNYTGLWEGSLSYAFPISERKRMKAKFDAFPIPDHQHLPDLIVLQMNPHLDHKVPDQNLYQKIDENEVFRVWRKNQGI